jgi:flagellar biosynthesis GTPase FlhF
MVFFFDEAHLLFDSASKALLDKIEQIVKLIRSKGVGIFFITQNPKDIPDGVLSQLGTKIQHALRAYTPAELKAAKAACMSFRENPEFDTFETLTSLAIGEALVSVLDEQAVPTMVKKCNILPPSSQMGAIDDTLRNQQINANMLYVKYVETIDRDSAYEFLQRKAVSDEEARVKAAEEAAAEKQRLKDEAAAQKAAEKEALAEQKAAEKAALAEQKAAEKAALAEQKAEQKKIDDRNKAVKSATKSVASSAAGTVGREAGKALGGAVGGKFGKTLGGNVGASLSRGIIGTLFKIK